MEVDNISRRVINQCFSLDVSKNMKLKSWWDNNSCLFKVLSDDLKLSDLPRQISEEQEIMKSPEVLFILYDQVLYFYNFVKLL